eukprot:gene31863-38526_t
MNKFGYYAIGFVLVLIAVFNIIQRPQLFSPVTSASPRNIYIDLGSHDGSSILQFIDKATSPDEAKGVTGVADTGMAEMLRGQLANTPCVIPGTTMNESFYAANPSMSTHTVPCIDIVTLFTMHNILPQDFVVIKMDIEGAEYELVPHIVQQKLWMRIDKLAVEWHHKSPFVFGVPASRTGLSEEAYQQRMAVHKKYRERYERIKDMVSELKDSHMHMFDWR